MLSSVLARDQPKAAMRFHLENPGMALIYHHTATAPSNNLSSTTTIVTTPSNEFSSIISNATNPSND